jgi:DNA-binding transcriptional LysR family regulator
VTDSFPQAARAVASGEFAAVLPVHAAADLAADGAEQVELAFLRKATRTVALAWNPRALRAMPGGERIQSALAALLALTKRSVR